MKDVLLIEEKIVDIYPYSQQGIQVVMSIGGYGTVFRPASTPSEAHITARTTHVTGNVMSNARGEI